MECCPLHKCVTVPKTMIFTDDTLELPARYKRMRQLVNCVQYKEFSRIFDDVITRPNCDSMCAVDTNNLSFLYYAVFHLDDPKCLKAVIEGFPVHQGIGFTVFVKDLFVGQLSKQTLEKCFRAFHRILTDIYLNNSKMDKKNGRKVQLVFVIIVLDILQHGLRVLAAIPNIILDDSKDAVFRILHAIMHWMSLFTGALHNCLPFDNQVTFRLLVQDPFLLTQWLCLNGT